MSVLEDLRAELAESTERLLATVAKLTDDDLRAPSLLPGWSRGHVLAHVARNADGHVNLLTWARTGVPTPQYPTPEARAAGIEAGAGRPVEEQLADLRESANRLDRAMRDMPAAAWSATVVAMRPPEHTAWYIPIRRIREVEVHHADLGAGYGWPDWPDSYVRRELYDSVLSWPRELSTVSEIVCEEPGGGEPIVWRGLGAGPAVHGAPRELLAWLTGRSAGEGVHARPTGHGRDDAPALSGGIELSGETTADTPPAPPPWLVMPAPPGLPADPPACWPPARD
ncbi:maleylpyruvate isomerase family mycothiol-dependent enzyme [Microbispora sp. NPDC049125]|uniref:maleylpyruvate isomerase family mycothiol-dependent enzyme n=1 Tax=Microbispora sp. NPDC049125 TaxID=3154929 RepID=UPI0034675C07